mgnify:CR=1 FL=1|tara:strand:+ start:3157 stop:4206 length:1050 start_codon:yes stop_codon:yes gene_type:complete
MTTELSSTIVHIRSKDAVNFPEGEDLRTHFEIILGMPITCFEDEFLQLEVASMEVPFSFYGTNNNNNILQIRELGQPDVNLTIPQGNYNIDELIEQIETQMNAGTAIGATYTWTYDIITNKVTVATDSAQSCIFLFNSGSEANNLASPFGRSIAKQIGWTGDFDITITNGNPQTGNSRVDLITIHSLYLRSNISLGNTLTSQTGTNSSILVKVPIEVNPLEMIYFSNESFGAGRNYLSDRSITNLIFRLSDQNGNTIDLGDEINFEFTLIFTVHKKRLRSNKVKERIQFSESVEVDEDKASDIPHVAVHDTLSHPVLKQQKEEIDKINNIEEKGFDKTLNDYQKILNTV